MPNLFVSIYASIFQSLCHNYVGSNVCKQNGVAESESLFLEHLLTIDGHVNIEFFFVLRIA